MINEDLNRKMKVVHISLSDDKGGAAIAAYRLHHAMCEYGVDSKMLVLEKRRADSSINLLYNNDFEMYLDKIRVYGLGEHIFHKLNERGYYSPFSFYGNIRNNIIIREADYICLHWISRNLIGKRDIMYLLNQGKKVVWVMHDMFPCTGGCHHSLNCEGYKDNCMNCPFWGGKNKIAYRQLKKKRCLKNFNNMYWIAPSQWLYTKASESSVIDNNRLIKIQNVPSKAFFSLDRKFSKTALGLDDNKRYILYGADGVFSNPYKGLDYFILVMKELYAKLSESDMLKNIELVLYGVSYCKELAESIPFYINFMGAVKDERTMNLIYNASDLMIITSIAENYPLTVQEAIACGTQVVGFDVGGISEIISNNRGYVINPFDITGMTVKILEVLRENQVIKSSFNPDDIRKKVVDRYIELFENG